ncbi:hypothetical protein BCR42DRAFT_447843 [Absidia repens]|uniref:Integrase zinc-binding domain-containing protein n=1 Tax=Absidia repens TaxID=90262 RepID=A0A1X2IUT4_9FUNG|nr:hypothetical protein BCR42DRAFT_447843 [Absidia repens]
MEDFSRRPYRFQENNQYPSEKDFDDIVQTYLDNLSFKKRDKALVDQQRYDLILQVLQKPKNTSVSTAQFRFWVKKMFQLVYLHNGRLVVCHDNKPVAMREQIYSILIWAHRQSHHGGRDKTSTLVRRRFSWIPKELIARFVRHCPFCITRRNGHADMFSTYATMQQHQSTSLHMHHPKTDTTLDNVSGDRNVFLPNSVYQSPSSSPQEQQTQYCQTGISGVSIIPTTDGKTNNTTILSSSPTSALSEEMFYPLPSSSLSSSSSSAHSTSSSMNITPTTSSSSTTTSTATNSLSSCDVSLYMNQCNNYTQQRMNSHQPSPEEMFKKEPSTAGLESPSHSMDYYGQQNQLRLSGYEFMPVTTMNPTSTVHHSQPPPHHHQSILVSPTSPLSPACDYGSKQSQSAAFVNQPSLGLMSFF